MLFSAFECFGLSDLVDSYNRVPQYRTLFKTMLAARPEKSRKIIVRLPRRLLQDTATPLLIVRGTADEPEYAERVKLAEVLKQAYKEYEFISYKVRSRRYLGGIRLRKSLGWRIRSTLRLL